MRKCPIFVSSLKKYRFLFPFFYLGVRDLMLGINFQAHIYLEYPLGSVGKSVNQ